MAERRGMIGTPLLNIVLLAPEIPQNTGAVGRLCVCLDARLHLIRPLGFSLDESRVRRAGLDYWEHVDLAVHEDWEAFLRDACPERLFFASTKGARPYWEYRFQRGEYVVFGRESSGLPPTLYQRYRACLHHIPMPGQHRRSLNVSNAAAIVAYEACRQLDG